MQRIYDTHPSSTTVGNFCLQVFNDRAVIRVSFTNILQTILPTTNTGYTVFILSFCKWNQLTGTDERKEYLRAKLHIS
jgi:hypothetical protein